MTDTIHNIKEGFAEELKQKIIHNKKLAIPLTLYLIHQLGYAVGTFLANVGL